jgi:hypothetical protein
LRRATRRRITGIAVLRPGRIAGRAASRRIGIGRITTRSRITARRRRPILAGIATGRAGVAPAVRRYTAIPTAVVGPGLVAAASVLWIAGSWWTPGRHLSGWRQQRLQILIGVRHGGQVGQVTVQLPLEKRCQFNLFTRDIPIRTVTGPLALTTFFRN